MEKPPKILVLFAHPNFENSLVNKALIEVASEVDGLFIHDLYEVYPDFNIDVGYEQHLLLEHDIIVWQHPFYWYSCPPLLKQWIDLVLEYGWAYGKGGDKLAGKTIFNCITVGGSEKAYSNSGSNKYSITEFLRPFEQTASICKMKYLKPFVVYSSNSILDNEKQQMVEQYRVLAEKLINRQLTINEITEVQTLNVLCEKK